MGEAGETEVQGACPKDKNQEPSLEKRSLRRPYLSPSADKRGFLRQRRFADKTRCNSFQLKRADLGWI